MVESANEGLESSRSIEVKNPKMADINTLADKIGMRRFVKHVKPLKQCFFLLQGPILHVPEANCSHPRRYGKISHSCGKSPGLLGKVTISMVIFNGFGDFWLLRRASA